MPSHTTLTGGYELTLDTYRDNEGELREMLTISITPSPGTFIHIPFDQAGVDDIRSKLAGKATAPADIMVTDRMPTGPSPDVVLRGGRRPLPE